jgi:hypothetical protein
MDSGCPTDPATIAQMNKNQQCLLQTSGNSRRAGRRQRNNCRSQVPPNQDRLPLRLALRVKSAEFWAKLGEPSQALAELASLPERAKGHRSVLKVRLSVMRVIRKQNEYAPVNQ